AAAAAGPTAAGVTNPAATEERFTRELSRAAVMPAPQSRAAAEDRIASRLASLQHQEPLAVPGTASAGAPSNAWGAATAVSGSGTLYFVVRPDGMVKENVLVQKTAGFEDFDENARAALRAWRFEPLHGGRTGEQWGTITFHYRIREAR